MKKLLILCSIFLLSGCALVRTVNTIDHELKVADNETNYKTKKQVEDTARAMIASYKADKLTYEQYKDSEKSEEKSWSNNAKIRANTTAVNYNEYILKNKYVFNNNIPSDILFELEIIK